MNAGLLGQLLIFGIVQGALFSLMAVGFGVIYRSLRFFDVSSAGTYSIASYLLVAFWSIGRLGAVLSVLLALALSLGWAVAVEKTVYSRLFRRSASPQVLLTASLGVFIVIENALAWIFGSEVRVFPPVLADNLTGKTVSFSYLQLLQLAAGYGISVLFYLSTKGSLAVKALWALGEEPDLIEILGISKKRLRTKAVALGAFMIGCSSLLTALEVGTDPFSGMNALLTAAVIVVMGGRTSVLGWIVGSLTMALIHSVVIFRFSTNWTPLITFGILILIMVLKPEGLFAPKRRVDER
jgi:branched-chain amino acid transport system permease protein